MKPSSTDSLIKGTIILAAAALVARFLGLIQRVPLKHLLDDSGMATYGIAYNIYFLLLIVATAGIPSALSKLISERVATGGNAEADRIFRAAIVFAAAAGVVIALVLYAGAPFYAVQISRDKEAALAIRALAPALLLFPLIAILRGYFQGRQMMMAGGVSQIVEQIARVLTAVILAYVLLSLGFSREWAVAGASFGGVTGGIGALAVMVYFWRKLRRTDKNEKAVHNKTAESVDFEQRSGDLLNQQIALLSNSRRKSERNARPLSTIQIYSMIFKLSIPISLISLAVPMIYFIDSSTVIALLEHQVGAGRAKDLLGILTGRAQSLAGIPPILAIALSMSIVPVISSAYARKQMTELSAKASQALRISIVSGLPMVLALSAAARPINGLLFGDTDGTWIIILMTISSMFQILMMTSGAVLMGLGQTKQPMNHVFIGIGLKLVGSFVLANWWGIYGIIAATMLCFALTMRLNLIVLRRTVKYVILGKKWAGMILTTVIVSAAGFGIEWFCHLYIQSFAKAINYFIQSAIVGCFVLALYVLLLIVFRVVAKEDVRTFPAPLQKAIARVSRRFQKQRTYRQ